MSYSQCPDMPDSSSVFSIFLITWNCFFMASPFSLSFSSSDFIFSLKNLASSVIFFMQLSSSSFWFWLTSLLVLSCSVFWSLVYWCLSLSASAFFSFIICYNCTVFCDTFWFLPLSSSLPIQYSYILIRLQVFASYLLRISRFSLSQKMLSRLRGPSSWSSSSNFSSTARWMRCSSTFSFWFLFYRPLMTSSRGSTEGGSRLTSRGEEMNQLSMRLYYLYCTSGCSKATGHFIIQPCVIVMLVQSHKPEVLRLHALENQYRSKFIGDFLSALQELLPSGWFRQLHTRPPLMRGVTTLADAYYTVVTLLCCRRRLGEEYTYIAMQNEQHYEEEGVLLNRKTRTLLAVLELVSRNLVVPGVEKVLGEAEGAYSQNGIVRKLREWVGSGSELLANVEWVVLMALMLDWNKKYTILETLLGIRYIYTYKNDQAQEVKYTIEGYLILISMLVKAGKAVYSAMTKPKESPKTISSAPSASGVQKQQESGQQRPLCRICYDEMTHTSVTKCGHCFCWECIIQTLEMSPECPVCRGGCLPRQVVMLRNT